MSVKVELKKSRQINECGRACHIYLPTSLKGKEVIGLILKDDDSIVEKNEYHVVRE